jgi:excisionase family DNA binding protein
MSEAYYRIGQAAKILGISSYHLRRLCELGMVEAEFSGHQWRILVSEVEKLQRTGVPPIPSGEIAPPETNGARSGQRLLAAPSDHATASAEEALMSEHEVEIAQNKLERIKASDKSKNNATGSESGRRRKRNAGHRTKQNNRSVRLKRAPRGG